MSIKKKSGTLIDWVEVGKRLKQLRAPLTQAQFSSRVGISQGFLSEIERGTKEVGAEVLLRISQVCHKSIDWLLTGRG